MEELTTILEPNQKTVIHLQTVAKFCSGIVLVIGILSLLTWYFPLPITLNFLPDVIGMIPLTATGFICAASAILLRLVTNPDTKSNWKSTTATTLSYVTLILGCMSSIDYWTLNLFNINFLFTNKLFGSTMPLVISFCFAFIGTSLLLFSTQSGKHYMRLSQGLTLITALLSMFTVIGYFYHSLSFSSILPVSQMPLSSGLTFSLLCVALLMARPNRGFTKVLTRNTPSSILGFRFILLVLTLPAFLGYIVLQGAQLHFYDVQTGITLLIILSICVFSVAVWLNSSSLQKLELENLIMKNELEKKNVTLEIDAKALAQKAVELEEEKQEVSEKLANREKLLDLPQNAM